jgi:hypothetical protein
MGGTKVIRTLELPENTFSIEVPHTETEDKGAIRR